MLIYLVRHAVAEAAELSDVQDADRRLTPKGERKMRRHVRGLGKMAVRLDEIWTSPLVRAVQTAEILSGLRGFAGEVNVVSELTPGGGSDALLERLRTYPADGTLALVGHEPDLSMLGTRLLTGHAVPALQMKKGGVAAIAVDVAVNPPVGLLLWLMTPAQLRAVSRSDD